MVVLNEDFVVTFTTNKNEVDESKHIYLVDRDLEDNMANDKLLDSFVDIMAEYANKWINGVEIPFPKSFQAATEEMIDVNDHIQDFIDAKLRFTHDNTDRIGKNEMQALYHKLYPTKNISVQSLVSLLKGKGVKWEPDKRCHGIKGVFTGVLEKTIENDDENLDILDKYGRLLKPINNEETNEMQKKYTKMKEKYKLKIQKLEEIIKSHGIVIEERNEEEPKEEIIEQPKEEIIEESKEEPKEEIIEEPKEEIQEEMSDDDKAILKLQKKIDKLIEDEARTEDADKKICIRNKITFYVNEIKIFEKKDTEVKIEKKVEKEIKHVRNVEESKKRNKKIVLSEDNMIEFDADNFDIEL
jgi:hypothetical protein